MVATAFAFVEYSTRDEAIVAVQHASRIFDNFQIRVEHKVPKRLPTSHGGSPTSTSHFEKNQLPAQTQEILMMLYHRGVEVGMSQAAQAQAIASHVIPAPVYASYSQPYYPHYDNTLGMYSGAHSASPTYGLGPQPYHNSNVAPSLGAPQYVQGSAANPYLQHEQVSGYTHLHSIRDSEQAYAWPLPNGDNGFPSSSNPH